MTANGWPDIIGPLEILAPNLSEPLALRPLVRVFGGVELSDEAGARRTVMRFPDLFYRVATVDAQTLVAGTLGWAKGISRADLVRLDTALGMAALEGLADAEPLGSGYYSVRAVPNKLLKFIANVGSFSVELRPPSVQPEDPNKIGIFLDSMVLAPGAVARAIWDSVSFGYRIQGGSHAYITYEGQYVVYDGRRIYVRS